MVYRSLLPDVEIPAIPLADYVLEHAARRGDLPALIDGPTGRTITYGELGPLVRRTAAGLQARGLAPREVVAIWAPNIPEYALAFFGVALAGGTNTTANGLYTAEELRFQLVDSGARFLVTVPQLLEKARGAVVGTGVEEVFVFGEAAGATPFADLLSNDGDVTPVDIDVDEHIVTLPYSSGTTGLPKGVMLTHRNLVANICQFQDLAPVGPEDCVPAVLPFFHIYGQTVILNVALRAGARIVTMPRFDLEQFLVLCQRHRATAIYLAPPVVLALAKNPLVADYDLSSYRFVVSGAAPLDADLQRLAAKRLGCKVSQGYGLTETSPVTHSSLHLAEQPWGTVGQLLPNSEARIVDVATGEDAAPGAPGEVWIRGPHVMRGYLNNPEATARTIDTAGFLHTGDIGTVDEGGIYRIVDRLKELIKYKGYQVPPAELEGLLLTHPEITDACVIGVPDEEAGELPKAFVVLEPGSTLTAEAVIAYVAERVAPHKKVRLCEIIDAIPKSPSGKLLRRVLVERERAARG
jgi:acyl-CoA synthetase (AMP-forming)/AMP-acid ligase II